MRLALGLVIASVLLAAPLDSASAATPAKQACFGKDFSGYAQDLAPLGQTLLVFGLIEGGLGQEVQLHQAGLVPDSVIPNGCNPD